MFTEAYLGTYRISAMEVFCKWLTAVNHFRKKKLHCRFLTESSMRLWLYNSYFLCINQYRSSHPKIFCRKAVLKNFAKFAEKQLCQSLFFNKVPGQSSATLLKKRLWRRCFPVNFAKYLRIPFFIAHLRCLLLPIHTIHS